jgi:glycyl-tRNA synthetase beta chain
MPADLLLEIGCEEIPASFVAGALAALPGLLLGRLDAARIAHGDARALGSPRRIALFVAGVAERQPDLAEEVSGPPAGAAFDKDGKPTKAAEAFAKKLGIDVAELRVVDTPKGKYLAGTRRETGKASAELLPKLLAEAIAAIPFRKSMRWGRSEVAFGRPIHWIVALLGDAVLDVEYAGIRAGRTTYGHRFLAPAAIELRAPASYVGQLREAHVFVDPAERSATMLARLHAKAKELGGELIPDEFLVDENLGLVEEPLVVDGGFEPSFLSLPERLIVDVMRTHQRYFAVRDASGKLLPRYLAVVNTANDPAKIRKGNDRVMRARLSDARFFVDTDRKAGLDTYAKKLAGIRYHAKLGSVADKVARMADVAQGIAHASGADAATLAKVGLTAALAKADLAALTVGEFPEMQGYAGRDVALASGVDADVADAIGQHWFNPEDAGTTNALALWVGMADKLDHLVGGFAVGLIPTGSNDPFSMRRAFVRAVTAYLDARTRKVGGSLPSFAFMAKLAYDAYAARGPALPRGWDSLEPELLSFMKTRLVGLFDEGVDVGAGAQALAGFRAPRDVVEACIDAEPHEGAKTAFDDLDDLRLRIAAVRDARGTDAFAKLATAFKRAAKITKDVAPQDPDPARFDHPAEKALWLAYAATRDAIEKATAGGAYAVAVEAASKAIAEPMDRFFDKDEGVFVMADDLAVRDNRLRMLATIASALRRVARLEVLEGGN